MHSWRRLLLSCAFAVACATTGERRESDPPEQGPETMADLPVHDSVAVPPANAPVVAERTPAPVADSEPPPAEAAALPEPVGPAKIRPLTAKVAQRFADSPQDPATDLRLGVTTARHGKHYLAGNEKTLQAFYPHVRDIGGGYVGVGSDQAYLLMSWIRPEVAWFIDYDQDVVDIHAVYKTFFTAADTPAAMLQLWTKDGRKKGAELIRAQHPGERGEHLAKLYLTNRGWIARRLRAVAKRLARAKVPSYLDDQPSYDFVRSMLEAGRVRPLLANLLESTGVRGVAQAAADMGVSINVLYLSNAEEYWKAYPQTFRDNVAALPFADDAKILRTLLIWEVNEDYRYNIQPAKNFLDWLAKPYTTNVYDIVHRRGAPDPDAINFFETDAPPDASPAARRATGS